MKLEKTPGVEDIEISEIKKEVTRNSRAIRVGETLQEYRSKEAEKNIVDSKNLQRIRNFLNISVYKDGPPIKYLEVVIDDKYMRENMVAGGGLRMKGGQAEWDGTVTLIKYKIAEGISDAYRQVALEKVEKYQAGQEKTYNHEAQHIRNRENGLAPHVIAENLREYLTFRVLDEMSAFVAGELFNSELSMENIIKALSVAEKNITDYYFAHSFKSEASWYMSQFGNKKDVLSRKIDKEKYNRVIRQYFRIKEQDLVLIFQQGDNMLTFSEITNRLIIKLNDLLDSFNSSTNK